MSAWNRLRLAGWVGRYRSWLILALIVIGSGLVSSRLLDRGHTWGDDFAAYIMQARAIVDGNVDEFLLRSEFTMAESSRRFGPVTAPWGLPLLLAPVYAFVGMDFVAFKLVLTACFLAFLVAFFLLARTRLEEPGALLVTSFLAFNLHLLRAQNQIFADIPFLLWSTLALWLIERYVNTDSPAGSGAGSGMAIGLTICMAVLTRHNGILLFVPLEAAYLGRAREAWRSTRTVLPILRRAAIPHVVFALSYSLLSLSLPTIFGFDIPAALGGPVVLRALHHAAYYFLLTSEILRDSRIGGVALYALMVLFFLMRLAVFRTRDVPLLLYAGFTLAAFIGFPGIQGPRYIYPVLPVFFLFSFDGMLDAARRLTPAWQGRATIAVHLAWAGLAALSLVASIGAARENLAADWLTSEGPLSPAATALFEFVRNTTASESVIVFYKPRAMRLFTDRDSFLSSDCDHLQKGDYLVLREDTEGGPAYNQLPPSRIGECSSVSLSPLFNRQGYLIYAITPFP